jgi:hypothetical protein
MSLPAAVLMIFLIGIVLSIVLRPLNAVGGLRRRPSNERADLEAQREAKYQEIRDAELDFKTGKLSVEDYEAVDGALKREALAILDRIGALEQDGADREPGATATS